MAKLVVTYENDVIKKELFFKGETFSYSMMPDTYGKTGDAKCFERQLEDRYGDDNDEILEAAYLLDFGDEGEIEEALSVLSDYES